MAAFKNTNGVSNDHDPGGSSDGGRNNQSVAMNNGRTEDTTVKPSVAAKKSTCQKIKGVFSLTGEGATPVNWKILFLVVAGLFGSCYSITFLFPFLPDMILFFGYKEEEKGYFVGIIASAMFAGRIFGSYFWGWLSDVRGRRPVILFCLGCIMLTNLSFGFSVNIYMAVASRFLSGLANGLVGTSKTVLYEISDNTNQAVGMSSISLAWGSGIIIGPLVSGYIAEPATKYPSMFSPDGVFGKFPFLLPCLVACLMSLLPLILLAVFLPETLNINKKEELVDVKTEGENKEQSEGLLNRRKSQSASQLQSFTKPLVNRQLSRVKETDLGVPGHPAGCSPSTANLPQSPDTPVAFAPSILSLDYVDSGRAGRHEGVGMYGYGCIVTSQGDLLLPDMYRSRSSCRPRPIDRQFSNQSDSGLVTPSKKSCQPKSGLSTMASSHSNVHSAPLEERNFPTAGDKHRPQFTSLPDVVYKPQETGGGTMDVMPNTKDEGQDEKKSAGVCCRCWRYFIESKMIQLMKYPNVRNSVLIYTIVSFGTIGFDDVFTVWASTDTMYSGLNFSSEKIGTALGLSSAPLVLLQLFMFPKLEARFGAKKVFLVFCVIIMADCVAIPCLRVIRDETVAFWTSLLILMGINKIAQVSCFSANGLHINNSVPTNFAGSVNGLAMTYTAIGRTIAPTLGGSIFAWSIVHGVKIGFPFDMNLVFIMFSFTYLIAIIMCARLPDSLNKQSVKDSATLEELE